MNPEAGQTLVTLARRAIAEAFGGPRPEHPPDAIAGDFSALETLALPPRR